MFGSWVGDSAWMDHVVANHLNATVMELTGHALDGARIEDIGYIQVKSASCPGDGSSGIARACSNQSPRSGSTELVAMEEVASASATT